MDDYITYILLAAMISTVIATMNHEDKKASKVSLSGEHETLGSAW